MLSLTGNDKRIENIRKIIEMKLPVFIYGSGVYGRVVADYLKENGVVSTIRYVVDDEYVKTINDECPLSVYLEKYADESILVFGFYNYELVKAKRKKLEEKVKYIFEFHMTSLDTRRLEWDKQLAEERLSMYQKSYDLLADEKSRETMQLYLRAAVNGEFDELYERCHEDIAYFNELTKSVGTEVLVDCGAFDGDSIHEFVQMNTNYQMIYALEPDTSNQKKLNARIEKENMRDVTVVPKGVFKESTDLHFSSDGTSASHFVDEGDISISVIALDELLENITGKIMIKMDIEGCELDALTGARNTITTKHPCLAICVYHKEVDLIEIPQFIDSLVERGTYDYYLRFYGEDLAELVFYAIPK